MEKKHLEIRGTLVGRSSLFREQRSHFENLAKLQRERQEELADLFTDPRVFRSKIKKLESKLLSSEKEKKVLISKNKNLEELLLKAHEEKKNIIAKHKDEIDRLMIALSFLDE